MPDPLEYPDRPIVSVGGVVVKNGRALLIRRGKPPLEDRWSIPGGALELGETLSEGVHRELKEETGLDVRVGALIEVFERVFRDDSGRAQYHYVILDYLCEVSGGNARAGGDAREVAWVKEDELARYSLTAAVTQVLRKAFALALERAPDPNREPRPI
jgi:8-oxo-dGTP diphosphatase